MSSDTTQPALAAAELQQQLAAYFAARHPADVTVTGLAIRRQWCDPGKDATLLCALTLATAAQERHEQQYVGRVLRNKEVEDELRAALKKAEEKPAFGEAVIALPRLRLLLYAFPNDPKLRLFTPVKLQEWLAANLGRVWRAAKQDRSWHPVQVRMEELRYIPGKRFTGRCRVLVTNQAGTTEELRFIVKQLKDEKAAKKSYRNLVRLQASWPETEPGERRFPVRLPRPLACDERHAAVFLEELPGENLWEVFLRTGELALLQQAGALLAQLHRSRRRVRKRVSRWSEWRENRPVVAALLRTFPALRPRLQRLWREWRAEAKPAHESEVLLHGSFRLNHVFVHHGELALIDLDSLRLGPPAYDVANLISSLYYLESLGQLAAGRRRAIALHFAVGYAAHNGHRIAAGEFAWYLVSLLINKQMSKLMAHDHAAPGGKIDELLGHAETVWAASRALPPAATLLDLLEQPAPCEPAGLPA
ncbi:MAG: aminoglycoside phosphotransferase family protein [candidate division KSB1 bacterium]|nr:aminoglycoside phosphotransferase family protein [candidate division KSB1 bacterium]MDZ7273240.1 aminoglycoside phosphotransferase family protein [candidate division KSB1 bacterium]MDZ7285342.1 aminoglycoside phosphotransferase family protein [candidate division KSB1 bacterium]MDZ7298374.1 aminoglycoside phosphotransferase family protein [candidate division KSB1 bacterium]MDZ7306452.1 aminoglycoside phosphotransferase family protein [candidate division KSB1 bacterium]